LYAVYYRDQDETKGDGSSVLWNKKETVNKNGLRPDLPRPLSKEAEASSELTLKIFDEYLGGRCGNTGVGTLLALALLLGLARNERTRAKARREKSQV